MPTLHSLNRADVRQIGVDFALTIQALYAKCARDNISGAAAAIAFFSVLAAFPGLGTVISIYGLIADPALIERHLNFVAGLLPAAVVQLIANDLHGFLKFQHHHLGLGLTLSLFFTATCGRTAVASLIAALNLVYGSRDGRRAIRRQGVSLLLVLAILAFVVVTFALIALTPLVVYYLVPVGHGWRRLIDDLRWPLMALMMVTSLSRLYQLAPHRERRRWNWFGWGPTVATALWLVFSVGYSLYLEEVGSYSVIYGSVSSTVVLLIWLYLSGLAVLIGAEIDALRGEGKGWRTDSSMPRTRSG